MRWLHTWGSLHLGFCCVGATRDSVLTVLCLGLCGGGRAVTSGWYGKKSDCMETNRQSNAMLIMSYIGDFQIQLRIDLRGSG